MSLLKLPNELIIKVIHLVTPDEIVPLAITCRRVYDLSSKRLERHREFNKYLCGVDVDCEWRYCVHDQKALSHSNGGRWHEREYAHNDNHRQARVFTASELLLALHKNPDVVWYLQNFNFLWPNDDGEGPPLEDDVLEILKTMPALQYVDEAQFWEHARAGNNETITAMVLPMLGNLRELHIEAWFRSDVQFVEPVVRGISAALCAEDSLLSIMDR